MPLRSRVTILVRDGRCGPVLGGCDSLLLLDVAAVLRSLFVHSVASWHCLPRQVTAEAHCSCLSLLCTYSSSQRMPTLPFCAAAAAACPEQPEGEQRSSIFCMQLMDPIIFVGNEKQIQKKVVRCFSRCVEVRQSLCSGTCARAQVPAMVQRCGYKVARSLLLLSAKLRFDAVFCDAKSANNIFRFQGSPAADAGAHLGDVLLKGLGQFGSDSTLRHKLIAHTTCQHTLFVRTTAGWRPISW